MHYIHRPYQKGETVAAIATPLGEGGIAVIRISGNEALSVAEKVYSGPLKSYASHTAHFGKIVDLDGKIVDEVLILPMLAPRSYTGEDTVEIHCHGGSLITRQVLETVLAAGARAALPGEFTFKAYMNGKIDLAQAEAVQELISAKNEMALKVAENQLQGSLSKKIKTFQKELVEIAAILEAWVDFPEEGLEFASLEEVLEKLQNIYAQMVDLESTFEEGRRLHQGLSLCLVGLPNVGKSSLMNALLGKERAIVTEIAGTTRDLLEADLQLGGFHFKLLDTAGIRESEELIEQEGIRRSKEAIQEADVILFVSDVTREFLLEEEELFVSIPESKRVCVMNKIDLVEKVAIRKGCIPLSAKQNIGLEELKNAICNLIWKKGPPSKEEVVITNLRHKQALGKAAEVLKQLMNDLEKGVSPEFISADMRYILTELGTIIGTHITEDILSAIFSKFCVGK